MDISSLTGLSDITSLSSSGTKLGATSSLTDLSGYADSILKSNTDDTTTAFDSLLQSAMDMISETNEYTNEASEAELSYAMGLTDSTHDLQVAQMKANISLQYTVAVRNAVMDAYKEIMSIQF